MLLGTYSVALQWNLQQNYDT
eukprot:SAG31_NODE_25353_length_463_cov_0.675824_2_plen_20_part_01